MPRREAEQRLDRAATIWFERDLTERKRRVFEKKYPELKGRRFVPVATEYDPGTEEITFTIYDHVGMAKIVANYATDFPRADVKASETTAKIKSLGSSFGYSVQDIRRARKNGTPLEQRKANAARKAVLTKDEFMIAFGDEKHKLLGLLNQPNVPLISSLDNGSGQTHWRHKTGDQIVADLNLFADTVRTNTRNVESPNTLLLAPTLLSVAAQRRLGDTQVTVLEWWLKSQRWIRDVDEWHFLETAGVGGSPRGMAYPRDEDVLEHPLPVDFHYPVPVDRQGMEFTQVVEARAGGVVLLFPLSAVYMDFPE